MKLILLFNLLFFSNSVLSADQEFKIISTMSTGYVPASFQQSIICIISQNKVIINRYFTESGISTKEEKLVGLSIIDIKTLLKEISLETAVEEVTPCDGPQKRIIVTFDKEYKIYQSGSCSRKSYELMGPRSQTLKKLVKLYCPTSF